MWVIKDFFFCYKMMCGFFCECKVGWDMYGFLVEVEVCKSLGIYFKEEIELYGVELFIYCCCESVW